MKIHLCFIKWWVQPAADIETVRFHYCQARTWDGLQRRLMIYLIHSVSVNLDQCWSAFGQSWSWSLMLIKVALKAVASLSQFDINHKENKTDSPLHLASYTTISHPCPFHHHHHQEQQQHQHHHYHSSNHPLHHDLSDLAWPCPFKTWRLSKWISRPANSTLHEMRWKKWQSYSRHSHSNHHRCHHYSSAPLHSEPT